jgi:hypothetical protein
MRLILDSILARVLDQQRFAEAKNGALATICGAGGITLLSAYSTRHSSASPGLSSYYLLSSSLLFLALVVALWSFLPRFHNKAVTKVGLKPGNVVYFSDIRLFDEDTYLETVRAAMGTDNVVVTKLDLDIANQIIVNSQIAYRKHTLFRIAGVILFIGALPIIASTSIEFTTELKNVGAVTSKAVVPLPAGCLAKCP